LFWCTGFAVVEDFASREEVERLKSQADALVEKFDPQSISVFSTRNQNLTRDDYFLSSASDISFFFEEKAFDADGKLQHPKATSINKIGHGTRYAFPIDCTYLRFDSASCSVQADLSHVV
jgi:phytanoyl-CoA hydroxylase